MTKPLLGTCDKGKKVTSLMEMFFGCLPVIVILISIVNLIKYGGISETILHSLILMYFTAVATFNIFKGGCRL